MINTINSNSTKLDPLTFAKWITLFEKVYGKTLDKQTSATYFHFLKNWDKDQFVIICNQILAREEFFPRIATFNRYMDGALNEISDRVWLKVKDAAARFWSVDESDLDEKTKSVIHDMGGLSVLGQCNSYQLDQYKKTFVSKFKEEVLSANKLLPCYEDGNWLGELFKDSELSIYVDDKSEINYIKEIDFEG